MVLGGIPISKGADKFAGKRQRIHAGKCLDINNIGCMEAEELNKYQQMEPGCQLVPTLLM